MPDRERYTNLPLSLSPMPVEKTGGFGWEQVQRIADRMVRAVGKAFIDAVLGSRRTIPQADLEAAINTRRVQPVLDVMGPITRDLEQRLRGGEFANSLETTYVNAGRQAMKDATDAIMANRRRTGLALRPRFDITNPRSIEFLRAYDYTLIRELVDQTRLGIGALVEDGYKNGKSLYDTTQRIRKLPGFGLTQRQMQAVLNYENSLLEGGMDRARVDKLTASYREKMLKRRAENIARTETIRAANYGQQEAWRQAREAGLLPAEARRFWVVTPDDRLCPECRQIPGMNKDGVGLDEVYQTPFGPLPGPPAHPQCRCAQRLRSEL
jgi:hypothetical protein